MYKNELIRLNKFISYSGLCSRRKADSLIKLGLISVNSKIINKLGYKVSYNDIVKYNNKVLKFNNFIYIVLNKPRNCITTVRDNYYRKTIMEYIPKAYYIKYRVYPVGRLDKNTTGIILLTNNGILCNKLLHPKNKIIKTYKIKLNKKIKNNDIISLENGIKLNEGIVKFYNIVIIKKSMNTLYTSIYVGWNRILHRVFKKLGYDILYLQRISFGGLKLNKLKIKKEGEYKVISYKLIKNLLRYKNENNNNNKWS